MWRSRAVILVVYPRVLWVNYIGVAKPIKHGWLCEGSKAPARNAPILRNRFLALLAGMRFIVGNCYNLRLLTTAKPPFPSHFSVCEKLFIHLIISCSALHNMTSWPLNTCIMQATFCATTWSTSTILRLCLCVPTFLPINSLYSRPPRYRISTVFHQVTSRRRLIPYRLCAIRGF